MAAARVGLAAALAAAALVSVGALSRWPQDLDPRGDALIRLSWRVRSVRTRECHRLTPAELAALPAHMREPEVCEGKLAPYALELTVDGRTLERSLVAGAGARQDRPLYVYRDLPVAPGRHHLAVRFARRGGEEDDERENELAAPRRLTLEADLALGPGGIALVTYDGERRALVLRGGDQR